MVAILAYVFWHQPSDDADRAEYERRLAAFHEALAHQGPAGFRESATFRTDKLEWAPAGRSTYEDWYLLEDSAALDELNEAAITGIRRQPHDRAAELYAWGTAGLYRLRLGAPILATARIACWLAKPSGLGYAEFSQRFEPALSAMSLSLWGRQMTLGPAPEFCLHLPADRALPLPQLHPRALEPVWPRQ